MRFKRYAPPTARVLLGLIFVVFGLNGFLNFIPMPPPEGAVATFMGGLGATGYFFPLLKITEIGVGAMLLSGRFVPLALTLLAPISVNIFAMHAFLAPEGLGMASMVVALQIYLAWAYRGSFRGLLAMKAVPSTPLSEPNEPNAAHAQTAASGAQTAT